jgi:PPOX class probable F420-dependent enzyme
MGILPDSGRPRERLDREVMGWLTTITAQGRPQSSPVWFVVLGDEIYIQSQREAAKLRNIRANGKVSFHLDGDGAGGDIVTIDADAEILDAPPPGLLDAYSEKYGRVIRERARSTPEAMLDEYPTTVRLIPRRVRAW